MKFPIALLKIYINPKKVLANGIYGLFLTIDGLIYKVVSILFSLFYSLAGAEILNSNVYEAIADRVYLLVGVIALFSISVSLLRTLANPDNLGKNVIKSYKSLITSIMLIVLLPTIFTYAYKIQSAIFVDNLIGKFLTIDINGDNLVSSSELEPMSKMCAAGANLDYIISYQNGKKEEPNSEISITSCQGNYLAFTTLNAFLQSESDSVNNEYDTSWGNARSYMIYTGHFDYIKTFTSNVVDPSPGQEIDYTILISTACGVFLLYILLSFCIDLGIRAVKLAFYQVIAPIPVLLRMIPGKEGQFDKWTKQTISCFLESFVRIAIVDLVIMFAGNICDIITSFNWDSDISLIGKAILIMGLFAFAKQAPKLLSDAIGFEGGNLKFGIKDKLANGGALAAGAMLGGGITAGTRNLTNGFRNVMKANGAKNKLKAGLGILPSTTAGLFSGAARSAYGARGAKTYADVKNAASKGATNAVAKRDKRAAYKASHGGTAGGVLAGHASDIAYGIKNWATGGSAGILGKVAFEDEFKNSYSDFQAIYENPNYNAMDSQLQKYKAMKASGVQNYQGQNVDDAIRKLEGSMLKSRMDSIRNNSQSAAYSMYNIAKLAEKNPDLASSLGIDTSKAMDLQLKGNSIYDKNTGREVTAEKLYDIIEGSSLQNVTYVNDKYVNSSTGVEIDFEAVAAGRTKDGMRDQKKKASDAYKRDTMSVEYKEAKKRSENK